MRKVVLAISGGIDSIVLMHMVAKNDGGFRSRFFPDSSWPSDFIVAHFNHGIRGDEADRDAKFVVGLADSYGITSTVGRGNLGPECNEEQARLARYNFLFRVAGSEGVIVLAHHGDDLIETAVMNLIRGTGWRGLAPMSQMRIIRPFLNLTKANIVCYAIENNLTWVEDSTNDSMAYFRNRIRCVIGNWPSNKKRQLLQLITKQTNLRHQIDQEIKSYINKHIKIDNNSLVVKRYDLIMLPSEVSIEILKMVTKSMLTIDQLHQLLIFIKTAKPAKKIEWKHIKAVASQGSVTLCFRGVNSAK